MRRVLGAVLAAVCGLVALFFALIALWSRPADASTMLGATVLMGTLTLGAIWLRTPRGAWRTLRGASGWALAAASGAGVTAYAIELAARTPVNGGVTSHAFSLALFGTLAVAAVLRVRDVERDSRALATALRALGWTLLTVGNTLVVALLVDRFTHVYRLAPGQSPVLTMVCFVISCAGALCVHRGRYPAPAPFLLATRVEPAMGTLALGPGARFADAYGIRGTLGAGGMSVVYDAVELASGRPVALKLLRAGWSADPAMRARFVREAELVARIASEHLARVYGAGVDPASGTPWIAMEKLEGETLAAVVRREGRLSPAGLRAVLRPLCDALAAAHADGIVHRDVKPENIFVSSARDATGIPRVKLLDFGIAKTLARGDVAAVLDSATAALPTTAIIGSPLWMAPEQMSLGVVGPPTDVWALGLLAFWALTGQAYWKACREQPIVLEELMREKLFEPLVPASDRAAFLGAGAHLRPGFDAWFARCVARDPAARFQDTDAVLLALDAAL